MFGCTYNWNGSKFVTGGKDTYVRVYDRESRKQILKMRESKHMCGHSNRVQCVKYHSVNENLILSGGWDNCLVMYDSREGAPVANVIGPNMCGDAID